MTQQELLDYAKTVFNDEHDKLERWLFKPNTSLGEETPASLLNTQEGRELVKDCLDKLETGNLC